MVTIHFKNRQNRTKPPLFIRSKLEEVVTNKQGGLFVGDLLVMQD